MNSHSKASSRPSISLLERLKAVCRLNTISVLLLLAFVAGFSGCAGTTETGGKGKQALVCPQCKMVAMTVNRPYFGWSGHGYYNGSNIPITTYRDTCPGCQGAITTLFKEGKLKHKCSVCKESPFTCPLPHPHNG